MNHESCRHWDADRDFCTAKRVQAPRVTCDGCELAEPRRFGLGDLAEKLISLTTFGQARKVAGRRKKPCGCAKRRAALNRIGSSTVVDNSDDS